MPQTQANLNHLHYYYYYYYYYYYPITAIVNSAASVCDLGIETVTDINAKFANSHEKRLQDHINIDASRLLNVNNITRGLKRKKPFELVGR
jgi:hypothetical protein